MKRNRFYKTFYYTNDSDEMTETSGFMRYKILIAGCCLLIMLLGFFQIAHAEEEWLYRLDEAGLAHITEYLGSDQTAVIPVSIDDYWVVGVDQGAFGDQVYAVRAPALVTDWQDGAVSPKTKMIAAHGTASLTYAEKNGLSQQCISELDFGDGVIDLSNDLTVWSRQNGVFVFPASYARILNPGVLFYVPPTSNREMGDVYEVRSISKTGETITVTARQAAADLAYTSFHVKMENLAPDYAHMQILSDVVKDVSYQKAVNTTTIDVKNGGVRLRSSRAALSAKTADFKVEVELENGVKITAQIELELSLQEFNISFQNHFGTIDEAKLLINTATRTQIIGSKWTGTGEEYDSHLDVEGNLLHNITAAVTDEAAIDTIQLARIPFMTTGGFTFCVVPRLGVSAEGKITVSIDSDADAGFYYDGSAFTNLSKINPPKLTTEAAVGFSFRIDIAFTASLPMIPDAVELNLTPLQIDGKAEAVNTTDSHTNATKSCIDLSIRIHGKVSVGMGLKHAIDKFKTWFKGAQSVDSAYLWLSFTLFDGDYFNRSCHYEPDLGIVESCTKNGVEVVFDANGGEGSLTLYLLPGTKIGGVSWGGVAFPDVTRDGYDLTGWLDEQGADANGVTVGAEALHFYAQWKEKPDYQEILKYTKETSEHRILEYHDTYTGISTGKNDLFKDTDLYRNTVFHDIVDVDANIYDPGNYFSGIIANGGGDPPFKCMWIDISLAELNEKNYRFVGCWGGGTSDTDPLTSITYNSRFLGTFGHYGNVYLKNVTFADGILAIGKYWSCTSLESISIPDSVLFLSTEAFMDCISLQNVKLPSYLKIIPASCFKGCTSLRSIEIPEGVEIIRGGAFSGCTSLESITIPSSVKRLEGAFYGCTSLKRVILGENIEYISDGEFSNCPNLEEIVLPAGVSTIPSFNGCTSLKRIIFSSEQQFMDSEVSLDFAQYPNLEHISISAKKITLKNISALRNCESISANASEALYTQNTSDQNQGQGPAILNLKSGGTASINFPTCYSLRELSIETGGILVCPQITTFEDELTLNLNIHDSFSGNLRVESCNNLLRLTIHSEDVPVDLALKNNPALETVIANNIHSLTQVMNCQALRILEIESMTGEMKGFSNVPSMEELVVPEGCTAVSLSGMQYRSNHVDIRHLVVPASVQSLGLGDISRYENPLPVLEAPEGSPAAEQYPEILLLRGPYKLEFRSPFGKEFPSYIRLGTNSLKKIPLLQELASVKSGLVCSGVQWFEDQEYTVPATFETRNYIQYYRMPDHDVTLYAKLMITQYNHENEYRTVATKNGQKSGAVITNILQDLSCVVISSNVVGTAMDSFGNTVETVVFTSDACLYVEPGSFRNAANLRKIVVMDGNESFYSVDGILYDWNDKLLAVPALYASDELHIPEGTKSIADYAFGWEGCPSSLSLVTIPASVVSVGEHAFDGLSGNTVIYSESTAATQALIQAGLLPNPSFVLYIANGGTWSYHMVPAGSALPETKNPFKDEYPFLGWSKNEKGTVVSSDYRVPAGGVVLYAVFDDDPFAMRLSREEIDLNIAIVPEEYQTGGIFGDSWIEWGIQILNEDELSAHYQGSPLWSLQLNEGEDLDAELIDNGEDKVFLIHSQPTCEGIVSYTIVITWEDQRRTIPVLLHAYHPDTLPTGTVIRDEKGNETDVFYADIGETLQFTSEFIPAGWTVTGREDRYGFDVWQILYFNGDESAVYIDPWNNQYLELSYEAYQCTAIPRQSGLYMLSSNTRSGNVLGSHDIILAVRDQNGDVPSVNPYFAYDGICYEQDMMIGVLGDGVREGWATIPRLFGWTLDNIPALIAAYGDHPEVHWSYEYVDGVNVRLDVMSENREGIDGDSACIYVRELPNTPGVMQFNLICTWEGHTGILPVKINFVEKPNQLPDNSSFPDSLTLPVGETIMITGICPETEGVFNQYAVIDMKPEGVLQIRQTDEFQFELTGLQPGIREGMTAVIAQANGAYHKKIVIHVVDTRLKLPDGLKRIEQDAFADVDHVVVEIPSGVEEIADGAFEPHVTVICGKDDYAYERCTEMGLYVIGK